ncbi:unnamed protein product [Paramecium octaurelia]|uniref:SWIM-type domain-containing protein n=1 Tax=Paramecium octaurelia TaxID=43137 RepID=A0A8S1W8Q9_PAROT|nr:unnamed protein product [Paramecium octaurelia]
MELLQVTQQCVSRVVGLFKGQTDDKSLEAHKNLYDLHKHYEEAFYLIENKIPITKIPVQANKAIYIITEQNQKVSKVYKANNYICNCDKFNAREFQFCPHILAAMIADELEICTSQVRITGEEYLGHIKSF